MILGYLLGHRLGRVAENRRLIGFARGLEASARATGRCPCCGRRLPRVRR